MSSGKDKRLVRDNSITIRGNKWYDHSAQSGGHAVSLLRMLYDMSYPDAVTALLEFGRCAPTALEEEQKEFILPPANENMRRVYAYLTKSRGISAYVVSFFSNRKQIYEDDKYHNAVFVGMDENGIPRHAHKRSTHDKGKPFKQNVEGSDPKYSFNYRGRNGSLYVFEAPIDMLSYITLHPDDWQQSSYVACCGVSILPVMYMLDSLNIDTVYLCLDNDEAGLSAMRRMEELLSGKVKVQRLLPKFKDWNDELMMRDYLWET